VALVKEGYLDASRLDIADSTSFFRSTLEKGPDISFLGICAHFVDADGRKLRKALVGLRPVITHGGVEQATFLVSALCDYVWDYS
jgi:hypothetical protein